MITKSFKLEDRSWTSLVDFVQMAAGMTYCIQPSRGVLYFYQSDAAPTKDDQGIGVDPSGILRFKYAADVNYYIRVLYPETVIVTITEAA